MPELPEVETVVRELNKKLKGLTVASVTVTAPKLISVGPETVSNRRAVSGATVKKFTEILKGVTVEGVRRRAKMLIFDLSGPWSMLVHLKMTGQFIFEDEQLRKKTGSKYRLLNRKTAPLEQLPGKHTHLVFQFTNGSTLYFNDIRRFAYLKLVHDEDIDKVKELNEFGPEPFDKAFTLDKFATGIARRGKSSIKQVLLDPSVVAGIGNIYSDEILFLAKVRPMRTVASLKLPEIKAVFEQIVPVLKKGIAAKGSSVGDFVRTDGTWGTMGKHHFVYGKKKQPCPVCKTPIQSVTLGGRTACYCPTCQK